MRIVTLIAAFFLLVQAAAAQQTPRAPQAGQEAVVEIPSRGQKIRALLIRPVQTVGSVILLAGGDGNLKLAPDGKIGGLAGNQLVRTRQAYARAGFVVLTPDIAPDLRLSMDKVKQGARWSPEHGQDIGALVGYMRRLQEPVIIVGTSRAAVASGVMLAQAQKFTRPDKLVLTAPMLMKVGNQPSFDQAIGGRPDKAKDIPFLVVAHRKDACEYTNADVIRRFQDWMKDSKLEVTWLDGPEGKGDPCEAQSAHGFAGIDQQLVDTITRWIKGGR
jgi:dienelactone hydrolase